VELILERAGARHPAARAASAPALCALSLHVRSGEQLAVIGPSGAGKTTLLQLIAAALPPTEGRVLLDGQDPWRLPRRALQRLRGQLLLAPQTPPLPPRQRVVTAVLSGRLPAQSLWASLRSLVYPDDIPAAFEALERFDLGDKLFERVDRLAGGERQRVGLARAFVAPARLWLIDEPLASLDPTRAAQAMAALTAGARERGATLVTTLHQVDAALANFPRIVGLRDGALAFDLATAQVTPERLARLYAQRDDAPVADDPGLDPEPRDRPAPVAVNCR